MVSAGYKESSFRILRNGTSKPQKRIQDTDTPMRQMIPKAAARKDFKFQPPQCGSVNGFRLLRPAARLAAQENLYQRGMRSTYR